MSEPILDVLRRLREDARVKSAPDALEEKLIVAFREHHAPRGRVGHNWFWTSAAIAASLLVMFAWRTSSTTSLPLPRSRRRSGAAPTCRTRPSGSRDEYKYEAKDSPATYAESAESCQCSTRARKRNLSAFLTRPSSIRSKEGRLFG